MANAAEGGSWDFKAERQARPLTCACGFMTETSRRLAEHIVRGENEERRNLDKISDKWKEKGLARCQSWPHMVEFTELLEKEIQKLNLLVGDLNLPHETLGKYKKTKTRRFIREKQHPKR